MEEQKKKRVAAIFLLLLIFLSGFSSASAASPASGSPIFSLFFHYSGFKLTFWFYFLLICAEIVSGLVSNALSHLLKRIWSITSAPKTGIFSLLGLVSAEGFTLLCSDCCLIFVVCSGHWPFANEI